MEAVFGVALPAGCGAVVWVAAYVLTGGAREAHSASQMRRAFWRKLSLVAGTAGRMRLVGWLLNLDPWREAADAAARKTHRMQPALGREQALGLMLTCCGAACLVCALLSRSVPGALVPIGAIAVGVPLWDSSRQRRRARRMAEEMPDVLRALALALGSGETLAQAIDYVGSHGRGPAAQAFSRVAMRLRCGASTREALESLSGELAVSRADLLVTALLISQRTGSPLRGLLETTAKLAERQSEMERLLDVKTAQVRLSVRVVCLLPLVLVGTLSLISPDFQKGLTTPAGIVSVLLALAMDALALAIVRRLMKGVL